MPTKIQEPYFQGSIDTLCYRKIKYTGYYGTFVHTPQLGKLEVLNRTLVGVDTNGTIDFIIPINSKDADIKELILKHSSIKGLNENDVEIVDISNEETRFFFPGFIDTHIHAPQFPNNGIFGNSTLLDWLETYTFPLESSCKDLNIAREIYTQCVRRTLGYGTTTASYYATIHAKATSLLSDIALIHGQRAFIGKVCMNRFAPHDYIETEDECKASTLQVIDHIERRNPKGDLIKPVLTPRFAPSCTEEMMRWLGSVRDKGDYHCQTHLSENNNEIQWVQELFPKYDNYTDVYYKNGLLSTKTTLAHCIHLSDDELLILQKTGSGVSHCPTSNSSITSGEARVRWLLDNQINVSLGTDCSGGFTPSILEVAKHALLVSRHLVMKTKNDAEKLTPAEVLYLATMGGAEVLKINDKVGCFKKGLKFDAQLINLNAKNSNIDIFHFQKPKWGQFDTAESMNKFINLIDKWLFNGDDRNIETVYVNGRTVINNV